MAGASSVVVAEAGSAKAEIVETRYGEIRSRSGAQLRFTPAMQELCMTSGGYMVVLLFRHGVADAELRRCRDRRRARAGRSPRLARSEHQRRTLRVDGPSTHDRLGRIRRTGRLWSGVVDEPSCGRTRPPPERDGARNQADGNRAATGAVGISLGGVPKKAIMRPDAGHPDSLLRRIAASASGGRKRQRP